MSGQARVQTIMGLTTKDILLARLPRSEGRTGKPYKDNVGKWTVGVGHNISANGLPAPMVVEILEVGGISDGSIVTLLNLDVDKAIKDASAIGVYQNLDIPRQSVLADMVFNMGLASVLNFVNTLGYLARSDWDNASRQMLESKWANEVGGRAIELAGIIKSGEIKSAKSLVA